MPLSWAAGPVGWADSTEEERERVVKILLERNDVNLDSADKSGRAWKIMAGRMRLMRARKKLMIAEG